MKAFSIALALSCLLSQFTVTALADEQYASQTHSFAATTAASAGFPAVSLADMRRSRQLSNEAAASITNAAYEEAEFKLREALKFEPGLISAHCNLGLVLNKTGRAEEAIPHLEYAHRKAPKEAAPLVSLAASYQLCGKLDRAIRLYDQFLLEFPAATEKSLIVDILSHLRKEALEKTEAASGLERAKNYHWHKRHLKVYIHEAEGINGFSSTYNQILQEAFHSWAGSGTFSFEMTKIQAEADIECSWTDDPGKLASIAEGGEAVLSHRGELLTHARVTLLTVRPNANKISDNEIKALCLHEVGHALGLMTHSHSPKDVMYFTLKAASSLSAGDFSNLQNLYRVN